MDPITALLAAFAPVLVEGGKAAVSRWLAPAEFKASTFDQHVALRGLDLQMFQAVSGAGGSAPSFPWVAAVVTLMRPAVAVAVLGTWAALHLASPEADNAAVDNFAQVVGFYLFGDRTLFHARRALGVAR